MKKVKCSKCGEMKANPASHFVPIPDIFFRGIQGSDLTKYPNICGDCAKIENRKKDKALGFT